MAVAHIWKRPFAGFKGLWSRSWSNVILQQVKEGEASLAVRYTARIPETLPLQRQPMFPLNMAEEGTILHATQMHTDKKII